MATTPDYLSDSLALITGITKAVAPDLAMTLSDVLAQWSAGVAASHASVRHSIDNLFGQSTVSGATGDILIQLGLDVDVSMIQSTFAVQNVLFTASSGAPGGSITINQGFQVWSANSQSGKPITFDLVAPLTIPSPGSATGLCICEIAGSAGNAAPGTVIYCNNLSYLQSVSNQSIQTLGVDGQTFDQFRSSVMAQRSVAYAASAIEATAKGVPGCVYAYLSDPKDGSGHTTLYAAAQDGTLISSLQSSVQNAVNAVLPLTETCSVVPFSIVYAPLNVNIAVPSPYDPGVTTAEVQSESVAFADTLGQGATMQPLPWGQYLVANVAALAQPGADFQLTSAIPVVASTQLFRFLSPPAPPALGQTTGGSIPLGTTVYVEITYVTASGATLPSTETSITLTGSNNAVTVPVPVAPNSAVTSANVYASTSPGAERLQSGAAITTTSGATVTINSVSTTGALPPSSGTISQPTVTVTAS